MSLRHLFIAALVCSLGACSPKPRVDEGPIFAAIQENLRAMEREDLNAVTATIHPSAPGIDKMREVIGEIFTKYDLKYEVTDLKVLSVKDDIATVSFTQKTVRTGGAEDLGDNLIKGIHTLKKDGDKWKLLRSQTLSVSPIPPP